jgi:hypothetical protein
MTPTFQGMTPTFQGLGVIYDPHLKTPTANAENIHIDVLSIKQQTNTEKSKS